MTHEFKNMVTAYVSAREQGLKTVLATVVDLDGSSYRKPGVQMLIVEDGEMIGAVSGGCVEKDIVRQAMAVFNNGNSIMMTYDGRYRLGCEGILYILLELFQPNDDFLTAFDQCLLNRDDFLMKSFYRKEIGAFSGIGTQVKLQQQTYLVSEQSIQHKNEKSLSIFTQKMPPCFKLMIFGAEHDAVQLCKFASLNGWEVTIVSGPLESKTIANFPGASSFYAGAPDAKALAQIDTQTAVVLMTHNFANDLKILIELKQTHPAYIGLLGPAHRREKLFSQLMEYCPDIEADFIDRIHGPAGLNIGAETPQEIAISILSEILSVVRNKQPILLKEKNGGIHA
jgi:xanthine/CO dehydrogenase XdhC/CoxF family maturation factor